LEERASFLGNGAQASRPIRALEIDEGKERPWRSSRAMMMATVLVLCTTVLIFSGRANRWKSGAVNGDSLFSCPVIDKEAKNEGGEDFDGMYAKVSASITEDKDEFLKTFRTTKYDGWGKTYNKMKEGLTPFKESFFSPYLHPGTKLYESACGIGLNLLMTLEILQEMKHTRKDVGTGITVYGNEYVKESVERSEMVLGEGVLPVGNKRGTICTGDSTNLSHVPSNAFDLVYSGYITPLQDPLDIDPTDDWVKYDQLCESLVNQHQKDWMGQIIWEKAVKKQHDWYGTWVAEMARIAKPGAPVIVEEVSLSYCTNQHDWGGVDETFWSRAAADNSYSWNIDPESIEIVQDTLHKKRYHVFMLKNKD
jgi:hypothetical protein